MFKRKHREVFLFLYEKSRVLLMLFSSLYEDCFAYSFTLLNRGKPKAYLLLFFF